MLLTYEHSSTNPDSEKLILSVI